MKPDARTEDGLTLWSVVGAVFGLLAVAMAALAAHAAVPPMVGQAVQMQGWHALALLICGLRRGFWARWAGAGFFAGSVIFCGDIYALAFAGWHLHVAPLGGGLLMAGWALLAVAGLRGR